jgi:hypothetical protein
LSFGGAEVEDQILAFSVAQLVKPLLYNHGVLISGQGEKSHAVGLCRLLCAQRHRPRRRAKPNEPSPLPYPSRTGSRGAIIDHAAILLSFRSCFSIAATLKRVINLFPEPGDVLELLREIIRLITDSLSVQN